MVKHFYDKKIYVASYWEQNEISLLLMQDKI